LKAAEAQLKRLENQPRKEERDISAARVREAEGNLADQKDQLTRTRALLPRQAVSQDDWERREFAHRIAQGQLNRTKGEFTLTDRGAWDWDKKVAATAVEQARAQLEQTRTEVDRLVVTALVAGQVLQVNVRPGEFVGTPPGQALIVLGDI